MSEQDVMMKDFYGYTSSRFCGEVHAIIYNEFLACIQSMKEKIEKVHPERVDEIHQCFTSLLMEFSRTLDEHMTLFIQYYTKNFTIPNYVPLYGTDIQESEGSKKKVIELHHRIVATSQLNQTLCERIQQTEEAIQQREDLKARILQQHTQLKSIQQAQSLLDQLRQNTDAVTNTADIVLSSTNQST